MPILSIEIKNDNGKKKLAGDREAKKMEIKWNKNLWKMYSCNLETKCPLVFYSCEQITHSLIHNKLSSLPNASLRASKKHTTLNIL